MSPYNRTPLTAPIRVLVRHADAGVRRQWAGPDDWRGLTPFGHAQARELAGRLGGLPIVRVLSSPALRCRQSVVPLARSLGLDVEPCRLLAVDADPAALVRLLREDETADAVLCTHREMLLGVFADLARSGSRFVEGIAPMRMAAAWVLRGRCGDRAPLRYLPGRAEAGPRPVIPGSRV